MQDLPDLDSVDEPARVSMWLRGGTGGDCCRLGSLEGEQIFVINII